MPASRLPSVLFGTPTPFDSVDCVGGPRPSSVGEGCASNASTAEAPSGYRTEKLDDALTDAVDAVLASFAEEVMVDLTVKPVLAASANYARMFPEVEHVCPVDVAALAARGKRVVLVDVRTTAEQRVSMIPGAMTRPQFEEILGDLRPAVVAGTAVVAPYCTVGYRSGKYARELVRKHGLPLEQVRNHRGILLHTHQSRQPLVRKTALEDSWLAAVWVDRSASSAEPGSVLEDVPREAELQPSLTDGWQADGFKLADSPEALAMCCACVQGEEDLKRYEHVQQVHTYARPWKHLAHPRYDICMFSVPEVIRQNLLPWPLSGSDANT